MDSRIFTYILGMLGVMIGVAIILKVATSGKSKKPWSVKRKIIFGTIALALFGNGLYDLLHTGSGRYGIGDEHWTTENQAKLVKKCFSEASTLAQQHPEVMQTYCECSISKITAKISYKEYMANLDKPPAEQLKLLVPVIQTCYDTMMAHVQPVRKKAR